MRQMLNIQYSRSTVCAFGIAWLLIMSAATALKAQDFAQADAHGALVPVTIDQDAA